jgi:hypothetical protein
MQRHVPLPLGLWPPHRCKDSSGSCVVHYWYCDHRSWDVVLPQTQTSSTRPTPQLSPILRRPTNQSSSVLARASSQLPQYVSAILRVLYNPSHVSQTQGIGTIRSHQTGPEYEDDSLGSDEADDEDETEPKSSTTDNSNTFAETSRLSSPNLTPTPSPTTVTLPPLDATRPMPTSNYLRRWVLPQLGLDDNDTVSLLAIAGHLRDRGCW